MDRIDALIMEQDVELDPVKRLEQSRYLERYMVEERTIAAVLGVMNVSWGTREELKGIHWYDLGAYSHHPLYRRVWLAE